MDTLNTPTYRKKLQRLSAQDSGESRNKWQRVTKALREKDVDTATDAKHEVSHTHSSRPHPLRWNHTPFSLAGAEAACRCAGEEGIWCGVEAAALSPGR